MSAVPLLSVPVAMIQTLGGDCAGTMLRVPAPFAAVSGVRRSRSRTPNSRPNMRRADARPSAAAVRTGVDRHERSCVWYAYSAVSCAFSTGPFDLLQQSRAMSSGPLAAGPVFQLQVVVRDPSGNAAGLVLTDAEEAAAGDEAKAPPLSAEAARQELHDRVANRCGLGGPRRPTAHICSTGAHGKRQWAR